MPGALPYDLHHLIGQQSDRLPEGGELIGAPGSLGNVIEADQREIVRNASTAIEPSGVEKAERDEIGDAERTVDRVLGEHCQRGLAPGRVVGGAVPPNAHWDPRLHCPFAECVEAPFEARSPRSARHNGEMLAARGEKMLGGPPPPSRMVGDHSVDRQTWHWLVDEDHRHAIVETLLDDARGRPAIHHHDRANAILQHARDEGAHVVFRVRGVEQHALEAIGKQSRRKRGEDFGVEGLVDIRADQAHDVGTRTGEALRESVDAIAKMSSSSENACADFVRYARARRKSARHGRTRHAGALRNVGGGDERTAYTLLTHRQRPRPWLCTRVQIVYSVCMRVPTERLPQRDLRLKCDFGSIDGWRSTGTTQGSDTFL